MTLFQKYIYAALQHAQYQYDDDRGSFIGFVEELPICWAEGTTIEETRSELESVIEGWVLLSIRRGESLPQLGNVSFMIPRFEHEKEYA